MRKLNEALDHLDMEDMIGDTITVDEYAAKTGDDKDIVTVTFKVFSKLAGKDLVTWLERGYDWVLDASISDGELEPGIWLVFVEMERRSKVPKNIVTMLEDLESLTGMKLSDWIVEIDGDKYDADIDTIRDKMILNPNQYHELRQQEEIEVNEMRQLAGLETKILHKADDEYIKHLKSIARI